MRTVITLTCYLLSLTVEALTTQRQAELLHLLKHDCGSCHGSTLQGGLGPPLLPANLVGKSKAFLVSTVLKGRPQTAMPPWQELLTEPEISWLVDKLYEGINHAP